MLMIRLQRVGKKKQPSYRFVISEKRKDTQAGGLEILGYFNPLAKEGCLQLKTDRLKYWLSVGAQPSDTVHDILLKAGVLSGEKRKKVHISNKRKAKMAGKGKEVRY